MVVDEKQTFKRAETNLGEKAESKFLDKYAFNVKSKGDSAASTKVPDLSKQDAGIKMNRFSTFNMNQYEDNKKSKKMSIQTVLKLDDLKNLTLQPEDISSILDTKRNAALDSLKLDQKQPVSDVIKDKLIKESELTLSNKTFSPYNSIAVSHR